MNLHNNFPAVESLEAPTLWARHLTSEIAERGPSGMMALRRGQGAGRPLTTTSRFVPMVGELSNLPGDGEPALGLRGSPRNAVRHLQLPAMGSQTTCRSNATKGTRWAPKSSSQSTTRCESCAPKSAGLPRSLVKGCCVWPHVVKGSRNALHVLPLCVSEVCDEKLEKQAPGEHRATLL